MGSNIKEKSSRTSRNRNNRQSSSSAAKSKPTNQNPKPNPNPNPNPSPNDQFDDSSWYCTESQLEDILLRKLDFIYHQALSHLISNGHDETIALRSVLSNGHCVGSGDALSNIISNCESAIRSGDLSRVAAADLRQLVDRSLSDMIASLQAARPNLTRGDAMWCLFMSKIHPGNAALIDVPSGKIQVQPKRAEKVETEADVVESVLRSMENLSLGGDSKVEDAKKEIVLKKIENIRELEKQVKERKEWAQKKAMQAAKKLSNDLTELKILRMEKEEGLRMMKGKGTVDDGTMGKLTEMENALKMASMQVERSKLVVDTLNAENKEIRAEMEATKMEVSETVKEWMEVERKERKMLKKKTAWDRQRDKLMEEINAERRIIEAMEKELNEVKKAQKDADVKWEQEKKATEEAMGLVEEARRAKEETESSSKASLESLRAKTEIDHKRHKDDIKRLEDELSRLKSSISSQTTTTTTINQDIQKPHKNGANKNNAKPKESSRKKNRRKECMICKNNEVNVVFLPCAHQVICVGCNDLYYEVKGSGCCPACNVKVEQRVRVFGATS